MLDAVPTPPPVIFVEEVKTQQPAIFLGFMAVGTPADMSRLEKRAKELKFPASDAKNDKGQQEVMIMFPPGTNHHAGLKLYHDAIAGKFGPLKLEVVIITKDKAADGIDVGLDATAVPPSSVRVPTE